LLVLVLKILLPRNGTVPPAWRKRAFLRYPLEKEEKSSNLEERSARFLFYYSYLWTRNYLLY
jgi:hypothetical protein